MKYIIIPEQKTIHQLPFYFAVEEYVARKYTKRRLLYGLACRTNSYVGAQPTNRERSEYRLLQTQQYTHF